MKKIMIIGFLFTFFSVAFTQNYAEWVTRGLEADSTGDYERSLYCYGQALSLNPTEATIYFDRGIVYMKISKPGLALVDFNKSILLDSSNVNAFFNRCLANRLTGNTLFALADIDHYLESFPEDQDALIAKTDLNIELREFDAAKISLNILRLKFPDNPAYDIKYYQVCLMNSNYEEAITISENLCNRDPEESYFRFLKANAEYLSGSYQNSLDDINLCLIDNRQKKEYRKLKADVLFYLQYYEDACDIYLDLLREDSLNGSLLADYGHCLLQQKKYRDADSILTKSIWSHNDAPAYAYLGRGIARLNLGDGDGACSDWNKSEQLGEKKATRYLNDYCKKETGAH